MVWGSEIWFSLSCIIVNGLSLGFRLLVRHLEMPHSTRFIVFWYIDQTTTQLIEKWWEDLLKVKIIVHFSSIGNLKRGFLLCLQKTQTWCNPAFKQDRENVIIRFSSCVTEPVTRDLTKSLSACQTDENITQIITAKVEAWVSTSVS